MTVATTSKQSIGLFWKSLTKGKAIKGRYSTSPKMAAQWAKADKTLRKKKRRKKLNHWKILWFKNQWKKEKMFNWLWFISIIVLVTCMGTSAVPSAACDFWLDIYHAEWGRLNAVLCQSGCCMTRGSLGDTTKTAIQTSCNTDTQSNHVNLKNSWAWQCWHACHQIYE